MLSSPATWRAVSTATFVLFLLAWALEGFDGVPAWGWIALIVSGITFAVELALVVARRSGRGG